VLVLAPGVELVSVEEHCRARLAKFKVPSTSEVIEELPKTATGKIDKKPLRKRVRSRSGA
jgi:acyl-CoA synthetase (AMP-forming)/AMP-acid ligase II